MTRSTRFAILGGTLLILVAGTALASQAPRAGQPGPPASSHEPEVPPTAEELAHAVERLAAHDIAATSEQLAALSESYGLGGAIRIFAWADAKSMTVEQVRELRDAGTGWGQIAKELGVSPGIGSIMGNGGGHGRDTAPGQLKPKPNDDESDTD